MKIANWNVERVVPAQARWRRISDLLGKMSADVWVLTETHESLTPASGARCALSAEPDRESAPGERWVAIWSQHPLTPLPQYVSDPARCAAARVEHPELGSIIVYGCVLPWGGSTWRGIAFRDGAFAQALDLYAEDWARLRVAFPDAELVIAGDFNVSMAAWHYYGSRRNRALVESALADVGLITVTAGSGDPVARASAPWACIDHICISGGLNVAGTERWPDTERPVRSLSDHFGIMVTLGSG